MLNHHKPVCVGRQPEEVNPPPAAHCITDSVAGYHHIKLVLMNTGESTEERDNQTFIKCLNLLYMHNVMERDGSVMSVCRGGGLPQDV